MESHNSIHPSSSERDESDSTLFLALVSRAVLSNKKIIVEDLKVLYEELFHPMETICDVNRVESFGGA